VSEVSDVLNGPLPSMGLPLNGICLLCGFPPVCSRPGYLVDGPFYLVLLVQRSINHARPGSSKTSAGRPARFGLALNVGGSFWWDETGARGYPDQIR